MYTIKELALIYWQDKLAKFFPKAKEPNGTEYVMFEAGYKKGFEEALVMLFNPTHYSARLPDVRKLLDEKRFQESLSTRKIAAEIAVATGVPIPVVLVFIGQIEGFTDELNEALKDINEFYGN
jgi:hypothetical protein